MNESSGFFFDEAEFTVNAKKPRPVAKVAAGGCGGCPLGRDRSLQNPRMEPHGRQGMGVVVVGEAPGGAEDREGRPFVGPAGDFLRDALSRVGVSLDEDCLTTNVVQCRPTEGGKNRAPTDAEIMACRPRLNRQLAAANPSLILALGTPAIAAVLGDAPPGISCTASMMHGRIIPSHSRGCWVACGYHPSWYLRQDGKYDAWLNRLLEDVMRRLDAGPGMPPLLDQEAYDIVEDVGEAESLLRGLGQGDGEVAVDFEATGLDPWDPEFRLLLLSVADTAERGHAIPLDHPHAAWSPAELAGVTEAVKRFLLSPCPKIIQNWQYEEIVARVHLGLKGVRNVVCDTMLREHVLDNRTGVCGQEFQEFVRYGVCGHKSAVSHDRLKDEYLDDLARYGALDVRYCLRWKRDQDAEMHGDAGLERAYALLHEAIPVMVSCRERGIGVDNGALTAMEEEAAARLDNIETVKRSADCLRTFRKRYGERWKIGSHLHRKRLFFGVLGLEPTKPTSAGAGDGWRDDPDRCASDRESLEACLSQAEPDGEAAALLEACLDQGKTAKLHGTYLKGLRRQVRADGRLHPEFLLHTVMSYRSSSSNPNFQNFPKHDPRLARVRRVLVPRNGLFLEADYGGMEVCGYACITRDARLIECVSSSDPRLRDFHRRYAAELYGVDFDDVTGGERFKGKNGFVFPKFYGSGEKGIADANPQWSRSAVARVYAEFETEFAGVTRWQRENWEKYLHDCYIRMLTGFKLRFGKHGPLIPTQASNAPCQGIAFHRLLRALIDVDAEMASLGMRSRVCGQIHDSIVTDLDQDEAEDVVSLQRRIMERPVWDWCGAVPWKAEFSVGENLLDLEEI